MRRALLGLLLLSVLGFVRAQTQTQTQTLGDSILPMEVYFELILENHPVAAQARLLDDLAQANLLGARGGFDPKIAANWDAKEYEDKNYYQYLNTEVKVPTMLGLQGIAGYNTAEGIYINPETTVPDVGLIEVGLEAQLGQGLFIDRRRADLQTARLMIQENELTRQLVLNDLLADATISYWNWAETAAKVQIYEEAIQLAENRFEAVYKTYLNGDDPAIDTLEAFIRLEQRRIDRANELIKLQKYANLAWSFLWDDEGNPILPDPGYRPVSLDGIAGNILFEQAFWESDLVDSHPELIRYDIQTQSVEVDRRWAREQLKPELSVKYLQLALPPGGSEPFAPDLSNRKIGIGFGMPLFLRKARADVQKANIKLEQLDLKRDGKRRDIVAKAQALSSELNLLATQIRGQRQIVTDYTRLYQAEFTRFRIGESSLFKLQSRENSLIKARLDLAKLLASYPRVEIELLRVLGRAYAGE